MHEGGDSAFVMAGTISEAVLMDPELPAGLLRSLTRSYICSLLLLSSVLNCFSTLPTEGVHARVHACTPSVHLCSLSRWSCVIAPSASVSIKPGRWRLDNQGAYQRHAGKISCQTGNESQQRRRQKLRGLCSCSEAAL